MRPARCEYMQQASAKKNNKGLSVLEIVVAVGIMSLVVFSLGKVNETALRLSSESADRSEASLLLNEGMEAVRFLRDKSWGQKISLLTLGQNYYLAFATSTGYMATTTAPALIDGKFTRTVVFSEALRDEEDTLASSGANDPSARKVTIIVSWQNRDSYSENLVFYITDILEN